MNTFDQDLENFIQALQEEQLAQAFDQIGLCYSPRELGNRIAVSMVKHLSNENNIYPFPSSLLNNSQLLTIQKFLNSYGFHLEYYSGEKNSIHWYRICPNWK